MTFPIPPPQSRSDLTIKPLIDNNSSSTTRILLLGVWDHLSRRRRIQLGLLLVVMLASGGAELVSLGSIVPFLAVLSEPERLWQLQLVQDLASRVGYTQASDLLLPATLVFAAGAVLAALIRLINLWLNGRLVAAVGYDLSCEAYRRTLYQPYSVHLSHNTADVITANTVHINHTISALKSLLQLITSAVVAVGLLTGLLLIDAKVATVSALLFGSVYWVLSITAKRELRLNGQQRAQALSQQLKALQEGLGSIRDVLLDGSQSTFLHRYQKADLPQRQLTARSDFLNAFPRYAVEALGLVAISLLAGVLVMQRGDGFAAIPLLGALALGAQRLLPTLQMIYSGWASLRAYNSSIKAVLDKLNQPLPPVVNVVKPLLLSNCIRLKGIHFCYEPRQPKVLRGIDVLIRRGERIGIIGNTGSGKSTTVDLLMGLLVPTSGLVLVDGKNLHDPEHPERIISWRAAIAHVPQNIYLSDSSIAENIAFGVPPDKIDLDRVKHAASQAQISSFIESSSEGYETFVGERGIRLSGGQRQRIGIARALYKNAQVLVFDEATSALDTGTENALMKAVNQLSNDLTIIMVAHRLTTIQNCDRVIRLSEGVVLADGSPDTVLSSIT